MRPIQITNTLSGRKEAFVPLEGNHVRMYACGVTVYDHSHIGHAMQAIFFDVFRNYLTYAGYRVTYVRNYTDVDDKIIAKAAERNMSPALLAEEMIASTDRDLAALGVREADHQPCVSKTIPQIIAMIQTLIDKDFAYKTDDGDVYFHVRAKADYGKLSHRKTEDMQAGSRSIVQGQKRDPEDFALWKSDATEGASWDSPWGRGRPGWHIECSAMSLTHLGPTFDIHGGGRDLIFPHHENEIAQSEAANGKPFAKAWMHNGLVTINHQKMSKSLGNHILIRDALRRYPAEAVRLNFLLHHYTSNVDFSEEAFKKCSRRLLYYYSALAKLDEIGSPEAKLDVTATKMLEDWTEEFCRAMSDDFNTAEALAGMNRIFKKINDLLKAPAKLKSAAHAMSAKCKELGGVLGLFREDPAQFIDALKMQLIGELNITVTEILTAIQNRNDARKNKDFAGADKIRDALIARGIEIMDGVSGTTWSIRFSHDDTNA